MALTKKDFEIIKPTDQKTIFIGDRINIDKHDFQRRTAAENRV